LTAGPHPWKPDRPAERRRNFFAGMGGRIFVQGTFIKRSSAAG
jgi:hypothetical protein